MAKKNVTATIQNDNEFYKLIKITLILVICFATFYGITYFVTKNSNYVTGDGSSPDTIATIQYDKIIVGDIKNQKRDEYYVLLEKADSNDYALYQTYLTQYSSKEDALKVFEVDMNDIFNQDYYAEESNIDTDDMSEFRIKGATLLKIADGSITDFYEGKDAIVEQLKNMIG